MGGPAAFGQPVNPAGSDAKTQAFDIPAEDLGDALQTLGTQSSLNILYGRDVITGQRSAPAHGVMTRDQALTTLLGSSGLLFRFTGPDAVLIFSPSQIPVTALATTGHVSDAPRMMLGVLTVQGSLEIGGRRPASFVPYSQSVLGVIHQRLDTDPRVRGKPYKVVLRVRIDPDRRVHLASLERPSGVPGVDEVIADIVDGTVAPAAPPPDMPQPIWFELESLR